jgi:hypothetical protein
MTLVGETAWSKVVILKGVRNFVVDYFFYLKPFSARTFYFMFIDFETLFWIFKSTLDGEMN